MTAITAEHIATGSMIALTPVGEWLDGGWPEPCCLCGEPIMSGWTVAGEGPSWCWDCVVDSFYAPDDEEGE